MENKKCLMREVCDTVENFVGEVPVPCYKPHDPHHVEDSDALDTLAEICPELMADDDNPLLCCGAEQINEMRENFEVPLSLGLSRCPSCLHNWRTNFCQLTCSPRQSDFLRVTNTTELPDGRLKVSAIDYHMHVDYPTNLFESCKGVQGVSSGQMLLDLMCGGWGSAECNGERWLAFLGTSVDNGGQAPFQINYQYHETNSVMVEGRSVTPMNVKTFKCSESPAEDSSPCSCTDCADTCSLKALPEEARRLPVTVPPMKIMEMRACLFIGWLLFFLFVAGIFSHFALSAFKRKRTCDRKCFNDFAKRAPIN